MRNYKPLAIFCDYTAWFVSDLVGNPDNRFSHDEAHFIPRVFNYFDSQLELAVKIKLLLGRRNLLLLRGSAQVRMRFENDTPTSLWSKCVFIGF